ncbi:hypothetical protein CEQ90_04015 [Lewinellaceae bacterium SD302]|nr:hypothetical protein CEQ90_04015 [Lewinellaceae bacterium SD302]
MPFRYRDLLLFLLIGFSVSLTAQQSSFGNRFWLSYLENLNLLFNDDPVFTIVVSADQPTSGSVTVPTTGLTASFSVPAGATEIDLFDAILYSEGSDDIDNKGLLIETDAPVQLSAFHYRSFFSEASSILPESELGIEYLVTTPMDVENNAQPNSFVVVATSDATEVEIIPAAVTLGLFPPDLPITITLDAGENYQVQAFGDLSGSRVTSLSGEPLAVFAGAREANINAVCNDFANSHVWDQLPPIDHFSNLYYFVPFNGQNGDGIKITAAEDGTDIFFDCEIETNLNAGESYFASRTVPTVISSTGPVSLTHYNDEGGCNAGDLGDPNGLNYLPAELRLQEVTWFASDRNKEGGSVPYFTQHGITVIVPADAAPEVELDGTPLGGFVTFPADPTQSFASLTVSAGTHTLIAENVDFQAYAYGFNEFEAYTMNLGYGQPTAANFNCNAECDPASGETVITPGEIACPGYTTSFVFTTSYPAVGAWYWVFGQDTVFDETFTEDYVFPAPGQYSVRVVVLTIDGCEYVELINVVVPDCSDPCEVNEPDFMFFGIGEACVDSSYTFGITVGPDDDQILSALWVPQFGGPGNLEGDTVSLVFTEAGAYLFEVEIITEIDCQYFLPYTVQIEECQIDTVVNCATQAPLLEIILPEDSVCVDSTFSLELMVTGLPVNEIDSIIWQGGELGTFVGQSWPGIVVSDTLPITIFATLKSQDSCEYNTQIMLMAQDCSGPVTVDCETAVPDFDIILNDSSPCADSSLSLNLVINDLNGAILDSVIWESPEFGSFIGNNWTGLNYPEPGDYSFSVTLTTVNGCEYTEEILRAGIIDCSVPVEPAVCELYWPNAFSPNGDGVNDRYRAEFSQSCRPSDYRLTIYHRWGGQVFESTDPDHGWDGLDRGEGLNPGVFVYLAEYRLPNGSLVQKHGAVVLIR